MMSFTYGCCRHRLVLGPCASRADHRAASRLADCAGGHSCDLPRLSRTWPACCWAFATVAQFPVLECSVDLRLRRDALRFRLRCGLQIGLTGNPARSGAAAGHTAAPLATSSIAKFPKYSAGARISWSSGGQVERTGASFAVTANGRAIAARIGALRRAFAIGDTGLYDFSSRAENAQKTPNS